jgi:hypothetical protein
VAVLVTVGAHPVGDLGFAPLHQRTRALDHEVSQKALDMLKEGGWLTGFGVPFGLRRGPAGA